MGVETKIKIPLVEGTVNGKINEVVVLLASKLKLVGFPKTEIRHYPSKEPFQNYEHWLIYFAIDKHCEQFESGKEERMAHVMFDHDSKAENPYLKISFGAWGSNEEIAKTIVDGFGGIVDLHDCDSILIDYAAPEPKK